MFKASIILTLLFSSLFSQYDYNLEDINSTSQFYGQELNRTTYNLARMNMIMHDVHYQKFDIKQEDTLEKPQHIDMKFEAIVANPPFSAKWSANSLFMSDERFSQYGKLAPSSKADYAFLTRGSPVLELSTTCLPAGRSQLFDLSSLAK